MFRLGIIEESLKHKGVLARLAPYLFNQRTDEILEDTVPVWHINEYHVPENKLLAFLPALELALLPRWYIHAFSDRALIVVLAGKSFEISRQRDSSWNEMIDYGQLVDIERSHLERIPLQI